ncbi:MAG: hypothetical protein JWN31_1355, partial [Frankiales bacterium]|nr:hypothetical protein [Frankiales bacterium]
LADFGTIQWTSCGVEKALSTTGALAQNQRAYAPVAGGAWRQAGRRGHGDRTSFGVDRYAMRSGREVLASTSSSTLATDTRSAQRVRTLGGFDVAWHAPGVDSASVLPPLPPHK